MFYLQENLPSRTRELKEGARTKLCFNIKEEMLFVLYKPTNEY
jgi:hypothetical protein